MYGTVLVCRDEREVDIRAHCAGKLYLCLFGCVLQSLKCHLVVTEINSVLLLEGVCKPVYNSLVEVVAAESCVAVCRKHFEHAVRDFKDRNIERTAAEVENHYLLINTLFVNTVCKRCCCRLVDNSEHFKARNLACILCCLSLSVVEVSGDCDNSLRYLRAEVSLCVSLQLLKNHCGDFLRRVFLAVDINGFVCTHFTFDTHNGSFGVLNCLSLCRLTDNSFF